jgi:hypothetical protein
MIQGIKFLALCAAKTQQPWYKIKQQMKNSIAALRAAKLRYFVYRTE